jgi:arylformamidase
VASDVEASASEVDVVLHHGDNAMRVLLPLWDVSIPVRFDAPVGRAFHLDAATTEPVRGGDFVGDTRLGGSCNCELHHLCVHEAGTHTEHAGHLLSARAPMSMVWVPPVMRCGLVRVQPKRLAEVEDAVAGNHADDDHVIDVQTLVDACAQQPPTPALMLVTAPREQRLHQLHSGNNPPYLTVDAMAWLRARGVQHLLVDLPSVDREDDGGLLAAHRTFFSLPPRGSPEPPVANVAPRTITELIAVPSELPADVYALFLQMPSWGADAAPSRALLGRLQRI